MILSCSNICKSFGSDDIIKNASFHIEDHEKAAIVGINGAGKSTLLKIIVGEHRIPVRWCLEAGRRWATWRRTRIF